MFERNGVGDIPNVSYTGGNAVTQKFVFKLRYRVIKQYYDAISDPILMLQEPSSKKPFSVRNATTV